MALELFGRHPEVPATLVLASAYAGWAGSLPAEVVEERLQRVLRGSEREPEPVAREFATTLFDDDTPPELVEEVVAILAEFHPVGWRAMSRGLAEADLRDVLPRVDVPTLLLYADADKRAPLPVAKALKDGISGGAAGGHPGGGPHDQPRGAGRVQPRGPRVPVVVRAAYSQRKKRTAQNSPTSVQAAHRRRGRRRIVRSRRRSPPTSRRSGA